MSDQTAAEVEQFVHDIYSAMSNLDIERAATMLSPQLQAVDGVTGKWIRGAEQVGAHMASLNNSLESETSKLRDMSVQVLGDGVAVATFTVDQTYVISGREHNVVAPTTMVIRHEDGAWKLGVFHSVPLPAAD